MRLINTETLELSEFYDSEIPKYAILSHTWGKEEVSYQEWCVKKSGAKAGYSKIRTFCEICSQDGFDWAWVDTCCIDKTSSAELSEAINSMYRWYFGKRCYAYLVDVPFVNDLDINAEESAFRRSRWFTRGWTLQELIAPDEVEFFTADWVRIGTKLKNLRVVESITGIPRSVLFHSSQLEFCSVAQKMSWAASRKTTRTEDIAYCLLGLFDVNMPLLYGEGDKAFLRLQEEIMKISSDHTIFAWIFPDADASGLGCGLLAPFPHYFAGSHLFVRLRPPLGVPRRTYSMTNHGLEIELPLRPYSGGILPKGTKLAILSCFSEEHPTKNIAIYLAPVSKSFYYDAAKSMDYEGDYERINYNQVEHMDAAGFSAKKIYVRRGGTSYSV